MNISIYSVSCLVMIFFMSACDNGHRYYAVDIKTGKKITGFCKLRGKSTCGIQLLNCNNNKEYWCLQEVEIQTIRTYNHINNKRLGYDE